ncbi:hypothetical protein BGW42_007418 [Actinomortierella wolfii]|nr:hypothetical protein BGW42_007418 [Actinomortierella wolfii]
MTTAMFKTGMNTSLLTDEFFQTILDRSLGPGTVFRGWKEDSLDSSASILSNISSQTNEDDDYDDFSDESLSDLEDSDHMEESLQVDKDDGDAPCPMRDMTGHFLYRIEYEGVGSHLANLHQTLTMADAQVTIAKTSSQGSTTSVASSSSSSSSEGLSKTTSTNYLYVVIKSKPIDTALIELTNIMAQLQGGNFAEEYDAVKDMTGFRNSHIREIELAQLAWKVGGAMERISTRVYNVLRNDSQQLYALCLEYLDPATGAITHMNSTDDALATWSSQDIHTVLRDVADFHAQFLGAESMLLNEFSFLENPSRNLMRSLRSAYETMAETNHKNEPTLFDRVLTDAIKDYLAHSDSHWALLEKSPRTLIHGDFNTRNSCLRFNAKTGAKSLCVYDWELACCHVPQRDVVEFLSFVLPPGSKEWSHYIEYHRLALKASLERRLNKGASLQSTPPSNTNTQIYRDFRFPTQREYLDVAKIALMDFASLRLSMYGISNSFKTVSWLPRIIESVRSQIQIMGPLRLGLDKVINESKM